MKYFSLILFSLIILSGTSVKGQQEDQKLKVVYWNHYAATKDSLAITVDEILKDPIITCSPDDFLVKSFVIAAVKGDDVMVINNSGGQLSDASINGIKSFTPGTRFWIEKLELTIDAKSGRTVIPMPTARFDVK